MCQDSSKAELLVWLSGVAGAGQGGAIYICSQPETGAHGQLFPDHWGDVRGELSLTLFLCWYKTLEGELKKHHRSCQLV